MKKSEIEIENFIIENFKRLNISQCSKFLKISRGKVYKILNKKNLKLSKQDKKKIRSLAALNKNKNKTQHDYESFTKIDTAEKAYFLGYFWADGHLEKNQLYLAINEDDMDQVIDVFRKIAKWKMSHTKKNKIKKIRICNQRLCKIFKKMGFKEKSYITHDKVLKYIPENLKSYWLRGLFDGDGCVSVNYKTGFQPKVFITSTIEQEWHGLSNLLESLGIKHTTNKKTHQFKYKNKIKQGHSSNILISSREDIFKFFDYIYNISLKKFGLKRKYNKFIDIFNRPMKRKLQKNKFMLENTFTYWD